MYGVKRPEVKQSPGLSRVRVNPGIKIKGVAIGIDRSGSPILRYKMGQDQTY